MHWMVMPCLYVLPAQLGNTKITWVVIRCLSDSCWKGVRQLSDTIIFENWILHFWSCGGHLKEHWVVSSWMTFKPLCCLECMPHNCHSEKKFLHFSSSLLCVIFLSCLCACWHMKIAFDPLFCYFINVILTIMLLIVWNVMPSLFVFTLLLYLHKLTQHKWRQLQRLTRLYGSLG